jgi:hypothetical protein
MVMRRGEGDVDDSEWAAAQSPLLASALTGELELALWFISQVVHTPREPAPSNARAPKMILSITTRCCGLILEPFDLLFQSEIFHLQTGDLMPKIVRCHFHKVTR